MHYKCLRSVRDSMRGFKEAYYIDSHFLICVFPTVLLLCMHAWFRYHTTICWRSIFLRTTISYGLAVALFGLAQFEKVSGLPLNFHDFSYVTNSTASHE